MTGASPEHKLDLPTMARALAEVLNRFGPTDSAPELLQRLVQKDPCLFFTAGIAQLGLEPGSPGRGRQSLRLFDAPAFLLELVRSPAFSDGELKAFCARYIHEDPLLDVKLARLMPGRRSNSYQLETRFILRILSVLDEISPGPRLLMVIGHLPGYREQRVASKAALLVGRRLQNHEWIERHLASPDPRIRANVVEALWGHDSALAARTLRECLQDENNRVRGNAMIGMYLLGDRDFNSSIRELAQDSRPVYRQTAAWVIGYVRDEEFRPVLEGMLSDLDNRVRQTAKHALARLCEVQQGTTEPTFGACGSIKSDCKCPTAEDERPEPGMQDDLATTVIEQIDALADRPAKDTSRLAASEPDTPSSHLRLDGRYVTGG